MIHLGRFLNALRVSTILKNSFIETLPSLANLLIKEGSKERIGEKEKNFLILRNFITVFRKLKFV